MFVSNIDPCMIRPCEHGAKCTPLPNGNYTCDCPLGFVGQDCDEGIFFFVEMSYFTFKGIFNLPIIKKK